MRLNQAGPPGLEDWEALHPALFALHGAPIGLAVAMAEAPAEVRELVALVEAHPLALIWDGQRVGLRETDKARAAECFEVVRRCVEIVTDHQEEACQWLASLLR